MNIKSTFCNTPAPQRKKTKTADGTKNARRSVGQNARFASGNLRVKGGGLFLFKMVEPVCHVTEKEGDKFPHVAL